MSNDKTPEVNRRQFLTSVGTAAVGAAALATPGVNLDAAQSKVPRWGMIMDLRRCIGCRACTVACKAENDVSLGRFRAVIQEKTTGTFPNTKKAFLPLMCNHCEGDEKDGVPPCVKVCPTYPGKLFKYKTADGKTISYKSGGTYKRPDGLILVDVKQCVSSGRCIEACPYGVRSFNPFVKAGANPTKPVVDKCDMCVHRLDNGVEPSCVNTCQGRARIFGDLNDPSSEVSKLVKEHNLDNKDHVLLPEKGTRPRVYYIDPDNLLKNLYTQRKKGKLDHYVDQIP